MRKCEVIFSRALSTYLILKFDVEITKKLRDDDFEHICHFPISFFNERKCGKVISSIVIDIQDMMVNYRVFLIVIIQFPILIVLYFIIMIWINFQLTVIALVVISLQAIIINLIGKMVSKYSFNKLDAIGEVTSYL